ITTGLSGDSMMNPPLSGGKSSGNPDEPLWDCSWRTLCGRRARCPDFLDHPAQWVAAMKGRRISAIPKPFFMEVLKQKIHVECRMQNGRRTKFHWILFFLSEHGITKARRHVRDKSW
ncbi:hypothetical protein CEXT_78121, partial [Caerostris extrusa]